MGRKEKISNVLSLAKELFAKGSYIVSAHAQERQSQRKLSLGDIKDVVMNGYHEKRKDEYKEDFSDWNYAIRGKTLDDEQARICLAFDREIKAVVVTVIRLES